MSEWLKLNKSNCKNCYKCIRYCPVKSIRFSGNQARTIENECILCGSCYVICPQNAKKISSELEKVKCFIQSDQDQRVVASLAPSFVAYFEGASIDSMRDALKKLGFSDVEETAIGATIVKNEYIRTIKEDKPDILISSCCHSVNLLIQKYFPKVLPYLASTISPMQAHCIDIKKRAPLTKTVFIGPCLAKKDEADCYRGVVDAVLTFEELSDWLESESIDLKVNFDGQKNIKDLKIDNSKSRLFPTTGGILKTMEEFIKDSEQNLSGYSYIAIDGAQNCISTLKDIENRKIHKCFIEMSACSGSCIAGPGMKKIDSSPVKKYQTIYNYAGNKDFDVSQPSFFELKKTFIPIAQKNQQPSEKDILAVLKNMGKIKPEDELNCGSCGYDTCREKAIAVYHGKAEFSMCLPFLKDKAENFSDNIVNNTPNGIIVVNEQLEVQLINNSARKMLNVRSASDVLGEPIVRIIDPTEFLSVLNSSKRIVAKRTYLAEYDRYVEQTIIPDKEYHIIICMLRDITEEENSKKKKEMISSQTIDVANKVVDRQMRIVQEIASLLGETAAETKIALTKLKETISNE